MTITVVYWGVKNRALLAQLIASYGKLDFKWDQDTANTWPAPKEKSPFGQLPMMTDGDVVISQSLAINMYLAKKANLLGDTDADFAKSNMIFAESLDIYGPMNDAHYAPSRKDAMDKFFAETLPKHLDLVEKQLVGEQFCSKICLGDLALASVLSLCLDLQDDCLDKHPKIKAFFEKLAAHDALKQWLPPKAPSMMQYYKRE